MCSFPLWQRQKVQALRVEFSSEVDTADAYVDQIVLNLYAGAGETQVWVNEIEIGPVLSKLILNVGPYDIALAKEELLQMAEYRPVSS